MHLKKYLEIEALSNRVTFPAVKKLSKIDFFAFTPWCFPNEALHMIALTKLYLKKYQEAEAFFRKLLDLHINELLDHYKSSEDTLGVCPALREFLLQNYEKTEDLFQGILNQLQDRHIGMMGLAVEKLLQGNEYAANELSRVNTGKKFEPFKALVAINKFYLGKYREAEQLFQEVRSKFKSQTFIIAFYFARTKFMLGKHREAEKLFQDLSNSIEVESSFA